ncbi:MAG: electron transfer flavoprotein subunit alpha [Flavobacteriales bacterium]|nr:electron transfer flavoprotein subunit alpha [Flavobacteriales bacterium]|tara:strand:+ start:968 stop:1708 length:741 start_codon:yes stop_codon:yes gene_type:complete
MNILVCISKVPDTTAKIAFTDGDTKFDTNGVQFIVNPYDEWYALVRALEIKEAAGGKVTVINVGTADNDPTIRKALAIGADDAVRINMDPKDAMTTAKQITDYAKDKGFDMILCGKETIDYNGSQVAGMIAALLEQPYISYASKLDMNGNSATIERDIQGGKEVIEVQAPFVLSAAKGMAEARIPNMRGIMAARTKPLEVVEPSESADATEIVKFELPAAKGDCKYIDAENAGELLELLRNEAKVL